MVGGSGKSKKTKTALARVESARISLKHSKVLCNKLRKKRVDRAKAILGNLVTKKSSLDGKYYTSASKKILEVLSAAQANAAVKGLDTERLFIRAIKADKARTFIRPKSRAKSRGRRAKATNIEIVLEER